jgi:hypothetical protein
MWLTNVLAAALVTFAPTSASILGCLQTQCHDDIIACAGDTSCQSMVDCLYTARQTKDITVSYMGVSYTETVPGLSVCAAKCIAISIDVDIPFHGTETVSYGGGQCNSKVLALAQCGKTSIGCVSNTAQDFFSEVTETLTQSYLDQNGYQTTGNVQQTSNGMQVSGESEITYIAPTSPGRMLSTGKQKQGSTQFWVKPESEGGTNKITACFKNDVSTTVTNGICCEVSSDGTVNVHGYQNSEYKLELSKKFTISANNQVGVNYTYSPDGTVQLEVYAKSTGTLKILGKEVAKWDGKVTVNVCKLLSDPASFFTFTWIRIKIEVCILGWCIMIDFDPANSALIAVPHPWLGKIFVFSSMLLGGAMPPTPLTFLEL